ncbi:MAG TPA: toll/interleukin-1 receptor domain-containing protein [Burkholderiaceae bacterium]|nr:toll/interleukin-1 receptor domain-containing protein [Burkholderiaceae bacterium]
MSRAVLFISYVHEDGVIADALRNAIQDAFGTDVEVYQDKVSMQQGDDIHDTIAQNLRRADVLVIVSTGTGRPSHDWAGWELGFFDAAHKVEYPKDDPMAAQVCPLRGRIVTFCSGANSPRPNNGKLYIPLMIDPTFLDMSLTEFEQTLDIEDDDPILRWFGEIFHATTGEDLQHKRADRDRCKANIGKFRLKVFAEFKSRPKSVRRPQKKLVIRYSRGGASDNVAALRATGMIRFEGQAASVFGIPSDSSEREIRWQEFGRQIEIKEPGKFWLSTIERMLTSTDDIDIDNSEVIATHDQKNLYRLILTTSTTYYNDEIETSIYLVEFFRRPDHGNPVTSLLLKGLQITCRFRFLFLEDQSQFYHLNVSLGTATPLRDTARRIVSELDLLASDTFQANLNQPGTWATFVDSKVLEQMAQAWRPLRAHLVACCAAAMCNATATESETARAELAEALKRIRDEIRPHSDKLLAAMASQLLKHSR